MVDWTYEITLWIWFKSLAVLDSAMAIVISPGPPSMAYLGRGFSMFFPQVDTWRRLDYRLVKETSQS